MGETVGVGVGVGVRVGVKVGVEVGVVRILIRVPKTLLSKLPLELFARTILRAIKISRIIRQIIRTGR